MTKTIEMIVQFGLTFPTPGDILPTNGHYFPVKVMIEPQTGQVIEFTEDLVVLPGGRDPEMFLDAMISLLESFGVYPPDYKEEFTYRIEGEVIVAPKDGLNRAIRERTGPYHALVVKEEVIHVSWNGLEDRSYHP